MNMTCRTLAVLACGTALAASSAIAAPRGNAPDTPNQKVVVDAASTLGKALKGTAWAVVNLDGTLARGTSVTGTSQPDGVGSGTYEVDFPKNVDKCAYTATVGTATADNPPTAYISVSPRSGNAKGIWVQTWNTSAAAADEPFNLIVQC